MADAGTRQGQGGRLRADKHEAIMAGGCAAFARDGYERASIDAIAAAANVSTRTIYKHFADKAALFEAVVADAAARIAAEETALIRRRLGAVTQPDDLAAALTEFAVDWLATTPRANHRNLMRRVHAEAAHLGDTIVTTWWRAGAGRVQAELAAVFATWGEAGWVDVADSGRAAAHFSALVAARPGPPGARLVAKQRRALIADGVDVFLRAYRS